MTHALSPGTIAEFVDAVRATPEVNIVGAGTKPRLAAAHGTRISTTALRGIVEYDASEYTLTALAGTPLREIEAVLAERGQYLPFDPPLVTAGATLGGTVAAGLSGSGRYRFGGVRDFILGVRFIDGDGRLLRAGGKVVKNAAGFDLPKFFCGSLGRFGALVECTFKVFPRPAATQTLALTCADDAGLAQHIMAAGSTRWEIDALDADGNARRILLRLAAAPEALAPLTREVLARWPAEVVDANDAQRTWHDLREFTWARAPGAAGLALVKINTTPKQLPALLPRLHASGEATIRISAGGNVVHAALPATAAPHLTTVSAMTLWGDAPLFPGGRPLPTIEARIKVALDPMNRFPALEG